MIVKHEVPQGSILGPLLFVLFINDLPLNVNSQVDLYVDDTTFTASADVNNISQLECSLKNSMSEICHWAYSNKLPINESKSKVLIITRKRLATKVNNKLTVAMGDKRLENVECTTLLGLSIDGSLTFDCHVENLCKKLASRRVVLRKIRAFLPLEQRLLCYNAIICPVISYACVIWSSCNRELLIKVMKLQKRAARVFLYADRQTPSVVLLNNLAWIPFYEQCKIGRCAILYKFIHSSVQSYLE